MTDRQLVPSTRELPRSFSAPPRLFTRHRFRETFVKSVSCGRSIFRQRVFVSTLRKPPMGPWVESPGGTKRPFRIKAFSSLAASEKGLLHLEVLKGNTCEPDEYDGRRAVPPQRRHFAVTSYGRPSSPQSRSRPARARSRRPSSISRNRASPNDGGGGYSDPPAIGRFRRKAPRGSSAGRSRNRTYWPYRPDSMQIKPALTQHEY
jgi:hypothetical protein